MRASSSRVRAAGIAVSLSLAIAAGGCSLVNAPWRKQAPPPPPVAEAAPPAPPPVPALPLPEATHHFVLADDDDVLGRVQLTVASKEDTLPDIARRFNVGYEEIVRANPGVDPWLPGAGRQVVVPTQFVLPNAPREGVVINLAAMRIYYFPKPAKGKPQEVYTHPIGVGKVGWVTPEGVTKIIAREKDPTWRPSAGVRKEHEENDDPVPKVVPPGPDNPLGRYKFTLGWPSYLIHGTNKPYGVGLRSSHGCIRLYPEDIEKFYQMIPVGTQVRVVNQPVVFGWHQGQPWAQAYGAFEDDARAWGKASRELLGKNLPARLQKRTRESGQPIAWAEVAALAKSPRGVPVPVGAHPGTIEAVVAAAPMVQNRIPPGSNWDGADERDGDSQSYQQLLSEREPAGAGAANAKTNAPGG